MYVSLFKAINEDYRKFLRTVGWQAGLVQLLNPYRAAEATQYSKGRLGSACKTGVKNHHWERCGVSSFNSHCFVPWFS